MFFASLHIFLLVQHPDYLILCIVLSLLQQLDVKGQDHELLLAQIYWYAHGNATIFPFKNSEVSDIV